MFSVLCTIPLRERGTLRIDLPWRLTTSAERLARTTTRNLDPLEISAFLEVLADPYGYQLT